MPLVMLSKGKTGVIKKEGMNGKTAKFLESLGLTEGTKVKIVSDNAGDLIIQVFESRIAISKEMAIRIMVDEAA